MSLFEEFKRRNVFRVGAAYVVVGWLIIQVVETIFPAFGFGDSAIRIVTIVLGIGLIPVLIFAWAFELTPEGLKKESDVDRTQSITAHTGKKLDRTIMVLLALALGYFAVDKFVLDPQRDAEQLASLEEQMTTEVEEARQQGRTEALVESYGDKSIAVLAFDDMSQTGDQEYLSDGIAEELLNLLAKIPELRVISRSSAFSYKGKDVKLAQVAEELNVANILEGSVRKAGNKVRITAQLIEARSDTHLWSETYDRELDDIFAIQDEISAAVVEQLKINLLDDVPHVQETDPEAYDYYLRGREYLRMPAEKTTLASATELFDRAIKLDPNFARAYAGRCTTLLGSYDLSRSSDLFANAEAACYRALTLDDGSWEVQLALGNLYRLTGQYDKAILVLEAAASRQPNTVDLFLALGAAYSTQGDFERAEDTLLRAEVLDSSYWKVHNWLGHVYWDTSRYEAAAERYHKVIVLTPDSGIGYDNLGNTYLSMGNLTDAEKVFNASPLPSRWTYANRGLVYYYLGEFDKAIEDHKRALEIAPDHYAEWGNLGDAHRFIPGNEENARSAYERAIELAEGELAVNPNDLEVVGRLSSYHAALGNADEAERLIQRVTEAADPPGYPSDVAYFFAARAKMRLGDTNLAYDYLIKALSGFSPAAVMWDPEFLAYGGDEFDTFVEKNVLPLLDP